MKIMRDNNAKHAGVMKHLFWFTYGNCQCTIYGTLTVSIDGTLAVSIDYGNCYGNYVTPSMETVSVPSMETVSSQSEIARPRQQRRRTSNPKAARGTKMFLWTQSSV